MSFISILVLIFFIVGAADYLFGSRLKLGGEFERGFKLLGVMALSMVGMIVISPLIAYVLSPMFDFVYRVFKIDPSLLPAMFLANDMGGATLANEVARDEAIGQFNALVVTSMMGTIVSFTLPVSLQMVKREHHRELTTGLLYGIVTIPVGCFVAGLICRLPIGALCFNLLPLIILSAIIAVGIVFVPELCIKIFGIIGAVIKALIVVGLVLGVVNFLCDREVVERLADIEDGVMVCANASIVMAGMFPLIYIMSKLLSRLLKAFGSRLGINEVSAMGFVSTVATNVTTFGMMNDMDKKGVVLNSAFAVSASFVFAGHLAFTMSVNADYVLPVIVGKLVAGAFALALALIMQRATKAKSDN